MLFRSSRGLKPLQVDATVIAEAPKLAPHVPAICANLSADLSLPLDCVNVKATTSEGLGHIGRGEGIAVHAVVLVGRAGESA